MALTWPVGSLWTSVANVRWLRQLDRRPYHLGVLFDIYGMALRHSIPPLEYALYGFNRPEPRRDAHQYLYWNDMQALPAINERRGADNDDVLDKARFAKICERHGLAHVETLAVFDKGRQVFPQTAFELTEEAIWVKPLRFRGEAPGEAWVRAEGGYGRGDGATLTPTQLRAALGQRDCIVQPLTENHPDLRSVSNRALAALRVVTGMNEAGQAEFVVALIGLPHGARASSVRPILCSIEPETGRIRRATRLNGEPVDVHPDTGVTLAGVTLPYWRESVELARRAHAVAFPRFAFLGWDIALTERGPVLLEANSGWGVMFHQVLDGPIGRTAFSRLVSQYV